MNEILIKTDELIDKLKNTEFVKEMINLKEIIIKENIKDKNNKYIKEYIKNQVIFDFHIYYLNKEIEKLLNNKTCRRSNESN